LIAKFNFTTAIGEPDGRYDYGEKREWALGMIGARLHYLVFIRRGEVMRIISLCRANKREVLQWINQRSRPVM
jgi:uncharacterized protein